MSLYSRYEDVPWFRRSGLNTAFLIIHFISLGCIPLLLITCYAMLTGNVTTHSTLRKDR